MTRAAAQSTDCPPPNNRRWRMSGGHRWAYTNCPRRWPNLEQWISPISPFPHDTVERAAQVRGVTAIIFSEVPMRDVGFHSHGRGGMAASHHVGIGVKNEHLWIYLNRPLVFNYLLFFCFWKQIGAPHHCLKCPHAHVMNIIISHHYIGNTYPLDNN